MKNLGRQLKDDLGIIVGAVMVCFLIAVVLLLTPFFLIYAYFSDRKFEKDNKLFLERMNGTRFFCYNSRKSSVAFVREVILPELDPSVCVVFVDGRKVNCGADSAYISRILYHVKERKGFPYLLKIEDAQVIDTSVNNQFYSIMIGRKPIAPLLERINAFYNSTSPVSPI